MPVLEFTVNSQQSLLLPPFYFESSCGSVMFHLCFSGYLVAPKAAGGRAGLG